MKLDSKTQAELRALLGEWKTRDLLSEDQLAIFLRQVDGATIVHPTHWRLAEVVDLWTREERLTPEQGAALHAQLAARSEFAPPGAGGGTAATANRVLGGLSCLLCAAAVTWKICVDNARRLDHALVGLFVLCAISWGATVALRRSGRRHQALVTSVTSWALLAMAMLCIVDEQTRGYVFRELEVTAIFFVPLLIYALTLSIWLDSRLWGGLVATTFLAGLVVVSREHQVGRVTRLDEAASFGMLAASPFVLAAGAFAKGRGKHNLAVGAAGIALGLQLIVVTLAAALILRRLQIWFGANEFSYWLVWVALSGIPLATARLAFTRHPAHAWWATLVSVLVLALASLPLVLPSWWWVALLCSLCLAILYAILICRVGARLLTGAMIATIVCVARASLGVAQESLLGAYSSELDELGCHTLGCALIATSYLLGRSALAALFVPTILAGLGLKLLGGAIVGSQLRDDWLVAALLVSPLGLVGAWWICRRLRHPWLAQFTLLVGLASIALPAALKDRLPGVDTLLGMAGAFVLWAAWPHAKSTPLDSSPNAR